MDAHNVQDVTLGLESTDAITKEKDLVGHLRKSNIYISWLTEVDHRTFLDPR